MLALGGYLLHGAENSGGAQPSDVSEGVRWLERAAEGGNAAASCTLGLHYQRDKDMPKALAWTQKAAQAGDPACMLLYGSMLLHGTSAPKNPEQAFGWIKRASDAGLDAASYELAQMYLAGEGAPKDKGKALELLLRVAETEHSPGAMYRAGILLIGDKPAESLKLLTAAAELGHRMAMHDVAWSYLNAPKLKHDKKKAREWAEKGGRRRGRIHEHARAALRSGRRRQARLRPGGALRRGGGARTKHQRRSPAARAPPLDQALLEGDADHTDGQRSL